MCLADIENWHPETIRDVFDAAMQRCSAARDTSRELENLPFSDWGGDAAEAARTATKRLHHDLDGHCNTMTVVAAAAAKAADDVAVVRRKLSLIYHDAQRWGFEIDAPTNSVAPFRETAESLAAELAERIELLLAEADTVDDELARMIDFADGDRTVPAIRPDVQLILDGNGRPPSDSETFNTWWSQLTRLEKDALWQRDQYLGNHGGMPAEERDLYNRRKLEDEFTRAAVAYDESLTIASEHPDWASGENVPPSQNLGAVHEERVAYEQWRTRLDEARLEARDYDDLRVVREQLDPDRPDRNGVTHPDRMLLLLDTQSGDRPHAAIAQGNPDTADQVATLVPGTGSRPSKMAEDLLRADAMQDAAGPSTSVIAWFGYDAPQHLWKDAPQREFAEDAAPRLERFQDGLRASHDGPPSLNTVVGHSYGTTVVGAAASDGHTLDADQVVFIASPGTTVDHASELRLTGVDPADNADRVFATKAEHDPVPLYSQAHNGPATPLLIGGVNAIPFVGPFFGGMVAHERMTTDDFGIDPTSSKFGGITFSSDSGTSTQFRSVDTYHPSAHSEYWTPGNQSLRNLGSIIAGHGRVS